jgi:hypothetical protein
VGFVFKRTIKMSVIEIEDKSEVRSPETVKPFFDFDFGQLDLIGF